MVLAFWFLLLGPGLSWDLVPKGSSLAARILVSSALATALYLALVVLLQRSFRSIRDVLSLVPHLLHRKG